MKSIEFKEYIANLSGYIAASQEINLLVTSDDNYVLVGDGDLNLDYCQKNNLHILQTRHRGGTIVNSIGDICIVNFRNERSDFAENFMKAFTNYLLNRGLASSFTENDLLIDDTFKVASYGVQRFRQRYYTAIHVSITVDNEVIKNTCTKQQVKIPKGLTEYGISVAEVTEFAIQYIGQWETDNQQEESS